MIHKMNLWNDSFNKIKDKTKTIEMRLCDEKRSIICIGDIIEFTIQKLMKYASVQLSIYTNIKILMNYINITIK